MESAIRIRQKLLGQNDLQPSDFGTFFKAVYYVPYSNGKPFDLYHENTPLATMYADACNRLFTGSDKDICIYGQVGQELTNPTWT